jgi:predicted metal-dependent hydrolase
MRFDSRAKVAPTQTEVETIDGRRVAVKLVVNPRARHVSVRIDPTRREAVATAPTHRHLKHAMAFASERAGWIAHELALLPSYITLLPGAQVPLRGEMMNLVYEHGRGAPRVEGDRLIVPAPDMALFEMRLLRFLKSEAKSDLEARVAHHAATLGVRPARLQVKELRSRWGSCSADGVLAFSWRVVMAPPYVLDYLAAHEVAHLLEMNHSRRFWAQVAKCIPNYESGRAWLHEHGMALHAVAPSR